jgi:hypothetical protein
MSDIRLEANWLFCGEHDPLLRETGAQFEFHIDDICLTRNEDIWSRTIRDSVLVSAYPLAQWFASSWWRLCWEPMPSFNPSTDWKMAHELGAANHGYVWPRVLFASDGEAITIWSEQSRTKDQSVTYIGGLEGPKSVSIEKFQRAVDHFIRAVLNRLEAVGHSDSDLAQLWELVLEDRANQGIDTVRRLEARLGFDPETCPEETLRRALALQGVTGDAAMSELAPVFGKQDRNECLGDIERLCRATGMTGRFQVEHTGLNTQNTGVAPWQRGVNAARGLRDHIGNISAPIADQILWDLLGLTETQVNKYPEPVCRLAAVARPHTDGSIDFVPRKRHPTARRFELARFLGDHLREASDSTHWLTATDLTTSRQKFQRAFAAELLCPIDSLNSFLDNDYSESAQEDAAEYFKVSNETVASLLINNGYISNTMHFPRVPYSLISA